MKRTFSCTQWVLWKSCIMESSVRPKKLERWKMSLERLPQKFNCVKGGKTILQKKVI